MRRADPIAERDQRRREVRGDAWANGIAALAATAPRRLTPEQTRVVKTALRLKPKARRTA